MWCVRVSSLPLKVCNNVSVDKSHRRLVKSWLRHWRGTCVSYHLSLHTWSWGDIRVCAVIGSCSSVSVDTVGCDLSSRVLQWGNVWLSCFTFPLFTLHRWPVNTSHQMHARCRHATVTSPGPNSELWPSLHWRCSAKHSAHHMGQQRHILWSGIYVMWPPLGYSYSHSEDQRLDQCNWFSGGVWPRCVYRYCLCLCATDPIWNGYVNQKIKQPLTPQSPMLAHKDCLYVIICHIQTTLSSHPVTAS